MKVEIKNDHFEDSVVLRIEYIILNIGWRKS